MSFNTGTLIEDFVTLIQSKIVGLVIIAEDPNGGPRPSKNFHPNGFSACKITNTLEIGRPEYLPPDANGDQVISIQNQIEIQIQTFGPNAMGRLNCLKVEFRKLSFKSELIAINLCFSSASDVLNISTTLDTDWEQRAQMTISFNTTARITDHVGCIENASITGVYNDATGTDVRTVQTIITTP